MIGSPPEPLQVTVLVYDLLPAQSRFGSFLNTIGCGVHHTSVLVKLRDETAATEYAFGGHDMKNVTGIFYLPEGVAERRMPGLRPYSKIDMGIAFGKEWKVVFGARSRGKGVESPQLHLKSYNEVADGATSKEQLLTSASEDTTSTPTSPLASAFAYPVKIASSLFAGEGDADAPNEAEPDDDETIEPGTETMSVFQRRAWRIIQEMREDPKWHGTRYQLLGRNCNAFTIELVYALTGKRPPTWINRAAWVATSVPCLVPRGWIDEDDLEVAAENQGHGKDSSGESVLIAPPRADAMSAAPASSSSTATASTKP